jgi:hypothetical protein
MTFNYQAVLFLIFSFIFLTLIEDWLYPTGPTTVQPDFSLYLSGNYVACETDDQ